MLKVLFFVIKFHDMSPFLPPYPSIPPSFFQGRYQTAAEITTATSTSVFVNKDFAAEIIEYMPDLVEIVRGRYIGCRSGQLGRFNVVVVVVVVVVFSYYL